MTWRIRPLPLLLAAIVLAAIIAIWTAGAARRHERALMQADPDTLLADPAQAAAILADGRAIFARRCAECHGGSGGGDRARGAPDLTDGDWLYGSGRVAEIEQIVLHGIRSGDPKGQALAAMPAYATPRPYAAEPIPPLRPQELDDIVAYLGSLRGRAAPSAAATRGEQLFAGRAGCWDCHAPDGSGDSAVGAPNLLDDVWLYGDGEAASLRRSIAYGRAGSSPAFARDLSAADARAVAVFTAALSRPATEDRR